MSINMKNYSPDEVSYLASRLYAEIAKRANKNDKQDLDELHGIMSRFSRFQKMMPHHREAVGEIFEGYFYEGEERERILAAVRSYRRRQKGEKVQISISMESKRKLKKLKEKCGFENYDELISRLVVCDD